MKVLMIWVLPFVLLGCQKEIPVVKEGVPKKENVELKQPAYTTIDTRFEKLRQVALISVEKRRTVLDKENACIIGAKNREEISKCFNDANEKRKILGDEIKKSVPKKKPPEAVQEEVKPPPVSPEEKKVE